MMLEVRFWYHKKSYVLTCTRFLYPTHRFRSFLLCYEVGNDLPTVISLQEIKDLEIIPKE